MPQSLEAAAEALELMTPVRMKSLFSRPVINLSKDARLGCLLLTIRDTFLTKDVVMNLCMWMDNFEGRLPVPVGPRSYEKLVDGWANLNRCSM